jgi:hypothetical protein
MEYEIRVNRRFGEQKELDFVTPPNVVLPPPAPRKPEAQMTYSAIWRLQK